MNREIEDTRNMIMAMGFSHYAEVLPIGEDTFSSIYFWLEVSYSFWSNGEDVFSWYLKRKMTSGYVYESPRFDNIPALRADIKRVMAGKAIERKPLPNQFRDRKPTKLEDMELSDLTALAEGFNSWRVYPLSTNEFAAFLATAETALGEAQYEKLCQEMEALKEGEYCFYSTSLDENGCMIIDKDYRGALIKELRAEIKKTSNFYNQ